MNRSSAPRIALTCGTDIRLPNRRDLYEIAVRRAGGMPFFLSSRNRVNDIVARHDGFIIPGGRDLDPATYGESLLCEVASEDTDRVDFEFSLLHEIIRLQKPVLGICYGMQLLNVYLQGNLYQDVCLQVQDSLDHSSGWHCIAMEDNVLAEACVIDVNSSHHQAVKRLGKELKAFAYADDGVIEALHGEGYGFLVGVQWHPERMDDDLTLQLFAKFIEACRE